MISMSEPRFSVKMEVASPTWWREMGRSLGKTIDKFGKGNI